MSTAAFGYANDESRTAFPFESDATPLGTGVQLPRSVFVDALIMLGPGIAFALATDRVRLTRVARTVGGYEFDFTFGAVVLTVTGVAATGAATTYKVATVDGGGCKGDWAEGWFVFYDTAPLDALFTVGQSTTADLALGLARVRSLKGRGVTGITVANARRVMSPAPGDVTDPALPQSDVWSTCIRDEPVYLRPGYNSVIVQKENENAIALGARRGAGQGRPCGEVPTYPGEAAPVGSDLLSGGLTCAQTIRSVNGTPGPEIEVIAGPGFSVAPDPLDAHGLVVTADIPVTPTTTTTTTTTPPLTTTTTTTPAP